MLGFLMGLPRPVLFTLGIIASYGAMLAAAVPAQSQVIVGAPGDPGNYNTEPFGTVQEWPPEYQQVYAASAFPGPITITKLSFYRHDFTSTNPAFVSTPNSGTYRISLSTTSKVVGGLSGLRSDNIGPDNTVVFTGSLPANVPFGAQMDLPLATPFAYDPSRGNLLLDVTATNLARNISTAFTLDVNSSGTQMGRLFQGSSGSNDPIGLVTGFTPGFIAFSAFSGKLEIHFGKTANHDSFELHSKFTLGSASNGVNPVTEPVMLRIGTFFTTTIPPGSFTGTGFGPFEFEGVIAGVRLEVHIKPTGALRYAFNAVAHGASLTGATSPVPVTLTIGDDSGTASVTAEID